MNAPTRPIPDNPIQIFKGSGPRWKLTNAIPLDLGQKSGVDIDWENFDLTRPFTFPLSSTCVATVSYNPATFVLFLEFTDGTAYEYSGVPPWVVLDLVQSSSAGRYFNYHIREFYEYEQTY